MKVKSILRQHSLKTVKENTSIEIMRARAGARARARAREKERESLQTDRLQSRVSESAMTTLEGSTSRNYSET